ncbi:MAG: hypothetical protein ACRECD_05925 [Burkholderiaceae bacterium]
MGRRLHQRARATVAGLGLQARVCGWLLPGEAAAMQRDSAER